MDAFSGGDNGVVILVVMLVVVAYDLFCVIVVKMTSPSAIKSNMDLYELATIICTTTSYELLYPYHRHFYNNHIFYFK